LNVLKWFLSYVKVGNIPLYHPQTLWERYFSMFSGSSETSYI